MVVQNLKKYPPKYLTGIDEIDTTLLRKTPMRHLNSKNI